MKGSFVWSKEATGVFIDTLTAAGLKLVANWNASCTLLNEQIHLVNVF
jgi:hypothetical protein